jgi:hypothetical protein
MGHTITWDSDDKTVVLQEYTKDATKDDLYHLARKSAEMLSTVEHTVHLIIDERNINLILNSADMNYLNKLTPENQGAVVMVIPKLKVGYKTLVQSIGKKIGPNAFAEAYFATSVEEARKFLQDHFGVRYSADKVSASR